LKDEMIEGTHSYSAAVIQRHFWKMPVGERARTLMIRQVSRARPEWLLAWASIPQ
jgi:hypothetical protein